VVRKAGSGLFGDERWAHAIDGDARWAASVVEGVEEGTAGGISDGAVVAVRIVVVALDGVDGVVDVLLLGAKLAETGIVVGGEAGEVAHVVETAEIARPVVAPGHLLPSSILMLPSAVTYIIAIVSR
jgi:hypothetical protein